MIRLRKIANWSQQPTFGWKVLFHEVGQWSEDWVEESPYRSSQNSRFFAVTISKSPLSGALWKGFFGIDWEGKGQFFDFSLRGIGFPRSPEYDKAIDLLFRAGVLTATEVDWRPNEMLPEDYYST